MKHILELVHIVQRTRVHCLEGGGRGEEGREGGREERIIQDRGIGEIGNEVVRTEERKEA